MSPISSLFESPQLHGNAVPLREKSILVSKPNSIGKSRGSRGSGVSDEASALSRLNLWLALQDQEPRLLFATSDLLGKTGKKLKGNPRKKPSIRSSPHEGGNAYLKGITALKCRLQTCTTLGLPNQ